MLKVLYLPMGNQIGTINAWKKVGVQLEVYDFMSEWERTRNKTHIQQEFLNKVRAFQPNLIHMQLQFTDIISSPIIGEARKACPGVIITNWSGDVREHAIGSFIDVAKASDYSLISSTGQLDMYKKAGCHNVRYWQIGYDPVMFHPTNETNFKYDVSFLANNYGNIFPDGNIRLSVANHLRTTYGSRFGLFGTGYTPPAQTIDATRAGEIYNQSICTLSISNFNNISHYFSDRLLYCLASGRPTICWHFPGYESYFVDRQEIFIARSAHEVVEIVNYCKDNPDIANQIGRNGHQRVLKEHTYTSRIVELLHMTKLIGLL
jgi:spore maturation protein CgeB